MNAGVSLAFWLPEPGQFRTASHGRTPVQQLLWGHRGRGQRLLRQMWLITSLCEVTQCSKVCSVECVCKCVLGCLHLDVSLCVHSDVMDCLLPSVCSQMCVFPVCVLRHVYLDVFIC